MKAVIDTDDEETPMDVVRRAYTPEFLSNIATRFGFSLGSDEQISDLHQIGYRYILGRRLEDDGGSLKNLRAEYLAFRKPLAKFAEALETFSQERLAHEMQYGARLLVEPSPSTEFPELSEHQKKRGEPYLFELKRLLRILGRGVDYQIDALTSKGGRPKNHGLDIGVIYAADFWEVNLGRLYTVDHHQGSGITEAFEFTKALLQPLDDLTDTQVTSAMRAEVSDRRDLSFRASLPKT